MTFSREKAWQLLVYASHCIMRLIKWLNWTHDYISLLAATFRFSKVEPKLTLGDKLEDIDTA